MAWWETLLAGFFVVFALFFMGPGLKERLERSARAEKDWPGLLIPLAFVVGFIVLLIMIV